MIKGPLIFNACVAAVAIVLLALYSPPGRKLLRFGKTVRFAPSKAAVAILSAALAVCVVGNACFIYAKYKTVKDCFYYRDRMYVWSDAQLEQEKGNDPLNVFFNAESVYGYLKTVKRYDKIEFTYYLCTYEHACVRPGYVVIAKYIGDDPENFKWNSVFYYWNDNKKDDYWFYELGGNGRLMLAGDFDARADHLRFKIGFKDKTYDSETLTIPLEEVSAHLREW